MLKLIYRALNVKPAEQRSVALILGHGFFMGVFMATYQTSAEALFVIEFPGQVSLGILAAGVLGVITTALFAFLQNRVVYTRLIIINVITITVMTALIGIALFVLPEPYKRAVIFLHFALLGPLVSVFLLGFWGIFGRIFDLRQSKRIIGGIDTGQLTAAILTFFCIALLLDYYPNLLNNLLFVSVAGALMSIVFLFSIIGSHDLNAVRTFDKKSGEKRNTFTSLLKDDYIMLLAAFLALSMVAYLFVENSYLTVLNERYKGEDSANQLATFISWFNGTILILSFVFQTFFNDRIIANYGLKISLLISPVILIGFTIVVIAVAHLLGYHPSDDQYFWFFLFMALSKLFVTFLKDALESPAFKLYFMPLEDKIRFDAQARVEGVVNEIARVAAGAIISLIALIAVVEIVHYSYILVAVILFWIYVTGRLYNEYRKKIRNKLESQDVSSDKLELPHDRIVRNLESTLNDSKPERAIFSFRLLEKINPKHVATAVNALMRSDTVEVRSYAQEKMNAIRGLSVSDQYVVSISNINELSNRTQLNSGEVDTLLETGDISYKRIGKLCRSERKEDRQYAAELLGNMDTEESLSYIIELLHDSDSKVRLAAIKSAEKRHNEEVINGLIDNLDSPHFSNVASSALVLIGPNALKTLDYAFYKYGQSFQVMLKIIQIMGRIGSNSARDMLWNKIDFPDKVLVSQVLDSLGECGFKADINQISRIKYAIESDIEDISWNIGAMLEVSSESQHLIEAIREENVHDVEHIYTLLSMLYDPLSIQLVKQNIQSGSSEGTTYAIELLDVFLSEDLKQKIIPVLDDLSDSERMKKLSVFFPRQRLDQQQVLKFLINRDFNQTNRWSKACSLVEIGKAKIIRYRNDLISNLFNPDFLVKEAAAWAIYLENPNTYKQCLERLNVSDRTAIDNIIRRHANNPKLSPMRYSKVLFLKEMDLFADVPGLVLSNLVDEMKEVFLDESDNFSLDGENSSDFFIIYGGEANFFKKGVFRKIMSSKEFIGEIISHVDSDYTEVNTLIATKDTILLRIDKERFYEVLSDNVAIARSVIDFIRIS